ESWVLHYPLLFCNWRWTNRDEEYACGHERQCRPEAERGQASPALIQEAENQTRRQGGDADGAMIPAIGQSFPFAARELDHQRLLGRFRQGVEQGIAEEEDADLPGGVRQSEGQVDGGVGHPTHEQKRTRT